MKQFLFNGIFALKELSKKIIPKFEILQKCIVSMETLRLIFEFKTVFFYLLVIFLEIIT